MFAASSLVVAVLATYASVAVLSLSAAAPFSIVGHLPGVDALVKGIGWTQPTVDAVAKLTRFAPSGSAVFADVSLVDFGQTPVPGAQELSITNTTGKALPLHLAVTGPSAASITAQFFNSGSTDYSVPVNGSATITLTTNPVQAGPINASLEISVPHSGLAPKVVHISGAQAPEAPGPVIATPAAKGAVDLSWTPSGSVSGVAGYIVQRAPAGSSAFQQVGGLTTGTTAVDQTSTDGTYSYQVVAVATGSSALESAPGPIASATSDGTPPQAPVSVEPPPFIDSGNQGAFVVPVTLAPNSSPSDTITVTLTDPSGATATGQASGGPSTVQVTVPNAGKLAENSTVAVTATATDSVGNVSNASPPGSTIVDTVPPGDPTIPQQQDMITQANQDSYSVQILPTAPTDSTDVIHVFLTDQNGVTTQTATGSVADGVVSGVDASKLADGPISVTAWITDEAGNQSNKVPSAGVIDKEATPPAAPTSIEVLAGPNNPADVVTAASQSAVIVQLTFAAPPPAGESMVVWAAGTPTQLTADGMSTTYTLPPLDLSGLADGQYKLGVTQTDSNGNTTKTWGFHFAVDTGGPEAATSVGVPAGPNNPAGYVNAATQTAATIVAAFAAPTDPADQIALTVDGMPFGTQPGGSDQVVFSGDMSSLPDGVLQIQGTITDANGVATTFSGTLTKDTQPPPAPAAAYVVGPPPNTIAPADASCVKVAVAFNQAPDPSDTVTVSLSDGSTSVSGSAPAGDGQVLISCIDASTLSAGSIAVNVTVTDVAGNSTSVAGTTATKLPCPPS
jgi:large repetitive protein